MVGYARNENVQVGRLSFAKVPDNVSLIIAWRLTEPKPCRALQ
jgi:hypothetical protein